MIIRFRKAVGDDNTLVSSVTRIQFLEIVPHFASAAIGFADIGKSVE
jgi:hypothetical protein